MQVEGFVADRLNPTGFTTDHRLVSQSKVILHGRIQSYPARSAALPAPVKDAPKEIHRPASCS